MLAAPVIAAFFGVLSERFLLRKVHAFGHIGELILTVGISLVILAGVQISWGSESLPILVPRLLQGLINIGGMEYPIYRLFIIALSLAVLGFLALILYKTRLGMIVRAAVSDADMVNALGINVPLVFMFVFGVGTWLAGLAGVAIAPIMTVYPGLADQMGMDAFIVVVVGGFGSLGGAFIVSLICGFLYSYGVQFISQLAPVLMFIFMAVVLAIKPMGLFGERE
jgi:branched-chain amino acid transport system permease protein